jgi:AcrR family transcriptional regulator
MTIMKRKPTKRDLDAQKTKTKIFNTAIALFEEYGFETVTMDDIAQRAGVSKGNFYTHFTSKDSVLVEQFHRIDEHYAAAFIAADRNMSASAQLRLLFETMSDYCADVCGVKVMKIVYINQIGLGDRERILTGRKHRVIYSLMSQIVKQGLDTGEFKTTMPEDVLLEYLVSNARGLLYNWCLYDGEKDLKEMMRVHVQALIEWLAPLPTDGMN